MALRTEVDLTLLSLSMGRELLWHNLRQASGYGGVFKLHADPDGSWTDSIPGLAQQSYLEFYRNGSRFPGVLLGTAVDLGPST
jgi:hypothetical protein